MAGAKTTFEGEEKWETRRSRLTNGLRFATVHCAESFICLQEVVHSQLVDILSDLNDSSTTWDYVGRGRDDGAMNGEYSPILYRPGIWKLREQNTKWLSETPDQPSTGWDAPRKRILTIAMFRHKATGKELLAMNTHLDDPGAKARLESAKLILDEIQLHASQNPTPKGLPVFLAGDFNSEPGQEAYQRITDEKSPMVDLEMMVPQNKRYGDMRTFTGFNSKAKQRKIDFLFINARQPNASVNHGRPDETDERLWHVEGYAVLPNRFEDQVYSSDHRAVIGDVSLI